MAKDEEDDLLPDKDAAKGFYAKYEPKEILGRGISSTVRRCIEKETGKEFAAKIIDLGATTETGETNPLHMLEATRQEISILRQVMGHPYIIDLQDVFESDAFVFLVFELCSKGELFDYLTSVVTLSEKKTRTIMRQIFEDLCGTPGYLAPETLKCNMFEGSAGYSQEVDIWACGVIMFTLLVGCPPFWHRKQMVMLRNIMEGKYSFTSPEWADISEDPKDLIRKCLVVDPTKRITVQEVLCHPFFNQMVLLPEPSIDGRTTTYHLCEQNVHSLRDYFKYYERTQKNSPLMDKEPLKDMMETVKHMPSDADINIDTHITSFQQPKPSNAVKCAFIDSENFLVPSYPATSTHFSAIQQQHEQQRIQNIKQHQLHQYQPQEPQTTMNLHNYTTNLKRGLFYTQQAVVRAVVRIKRLRYTAEPLQVDEAIRDPYRIKVLRKVIDGCAFRVYGHWVKKGEGQNRAALFENTPRTELHALYINNLSR
uniref:Protein kinase domain-containing protein n=1 Tax=Glossina brevipalpis TaxID=37001 RepID=A0A1A9W192_9MUSC